MLEWIIAPANLLAITQTIGALVTAAATIALWRVTKILADETRILAKVTSQPYVVCHFEPSAAASQALNLKVTNTGTATAFDIIVELNPRLPSRDGQKDSGLDQHRFIVSILAPSQSVLLYPVMSRDLSELLTTSVSWSVVPKGQSRESIRYEMSAKDAFQGGWNERTSHHIAEELEKIRRSIK